MPYTLPFSMNPNYTWIIHGTRILNSSKLAVRRFVRPLPRRRAISKIRKQGFLVMRFEVSAARVSNFSEYHQIVSGRHLTRFQCQMGIVPATRGTGPSGGRTSRLRKNRSVCVMFASALEPCKMRYTAGTVAQKRFQPLIQSQQIYSICFSIHSECTKMR